MKLQCVNINDRGQFWSLLCFLPNLLIEMLLYIYATKIQIFDIRGVLQVYDTM